MKILKKSIIIVLSIFFINQILALDIEMKQEYARGETLITKISGIIDSQVAQENIHFYKGNVRIPLLYDIAKINQDFYLYAILPENNGSYILKVKDIAYREGSKVITGDVEKNFSITEKLAVYNVNPGYVVTQNGFFIKLHSLHSFTSSINIKSPFISQDIVTLKPGEEKSVEFKIENLNASLYFIEFSSTSENYKVPILLTKSSTIQSERKSFRFNDKILEVSLIEKKNETIHFYLYNTGQKNITNITLNIDGFDNVNLDKKQISNLEAGKNEKIKLFIYQLNPGIYDGKVTAVSDDLSTFLNLRLIVYSQNIILNETEKQKQNYFIEDRTCRSIGGVFCSQNQKCICNETVIKGGRCEEQFLEGTCCLGSCQIIKIEEEKGSNKSTIGWFIVLILLVALFWFFKRNFKKS